MFLYDYWLYQNAAPQELCERIISQNDWSKSIPGTVGVDAGGYEVLPEKRVTNVIWSKEEDELREVVATYFVDANKSAGWNFDCNALQPIQLGEYGVGGHYDFHFDAAAPDHNNLQRKLSMSILLNDEDSFEGGDFEFSLCKPVLKRGSILVFPSILSHRVTPVTKGVRYSAVAWAIGPAFK